MGTLNHPIVEDRIIQGEGTALETWQQSQRLDHLKVLALNEVFPLSSRICIVAPHPDDEILGCGGLIQQLDAAGYEIVLFAVTNGTASHPDSTLYTPDQLDHIRPQETANALGILDLKQTIKRIALNIQDGEVAQQHDQLADALKPYLQAKDILVTTFEHDGHPDHEITGQVSRQIAAELSLKCLQVLIWTWHWASPEDTRIPWNKALKLELSPEQLKLKSEAMQCFESQLEPDPSTGKAAIVSSSALERLLQPWEVYIDDESHL
ncbi:LmbE-like protein [Acinetobacter sp. LoGeW2-3]|uniref:PIG-L deacetylase family protein n=1 Tax=Acinetobacter sp. LoGeW2-3 TaxID=1808001 RepID=UPI000C0596BC|nr:PIG-L family deacetylase [Acinetobacter sp. LoGeW2-3]ATO20501.1 LmbE-like protein [Acinetobacter sp. LoGeW2-3]